MAARLLENRLQPGPLLAFAHDDELHAVHAGDRAQQRLESLVVRESPYREQAKSLAGPERVGLLAPQLGQALGIDAERDHVALVPPWRERPARLEVGARGRDDRLGALEKGALEEHVVRIGEAQRALGKLDVGLPMHHPRDAARRGQQQGPERPEVGHLEVQDVGTVAADRAREPEREARRDGREEEPEPDRAAHEPRRVVARIVVPRVVHEDRDLVAGRALRLHEIAQEPLHAAGHRRKVLADVQDAHGQGIASIFAFHSRRAGLSPARRAAFSMSESASDLRCSA